MSHSACWFGWKRQFWGGLRKAVGRNGECGRMECDVIAGDEYPFKEPSPPIPSPFFFSPFPSSLNKLLNYFCVSFVLMEEFQYHSRCTQSLSRYSFVSSSRSPHAVCSVRAVLVSVLVTVFLSLPASRSLVACGPYLGPCSWQCLACRTPFACCVSSLSQP